jgi:hypothetical protein
MHSRRCGSPVSKLGQAFHPWRVGPCRTIERFGHHERSPGLCPSQARLFLELLPFGTQLVDSINHPLQALLRPRPSKCQPVEASGCPHVDARQRARANIDWSAMRQCYNRSCQQALQFSPELLPSLRRVRNSTGSPIVGNAVSRHSPDLSTPTKMT